MYAMNRITFVNANVSKCTYEIFKISSGSFFFFLISATKSHHISILEVNIEVIIILCIYSKNISASIEKIRCTSFGY